MGIKIIWSETALQQIKEIYHHNLIDNSSKNANNLSKKIIDRTQVLLKFPEIGRKQDFSEIIKIEYRFLIEGNYKIIYHLFENYIKISMVFDTRQEPEKLVNFLKNE